MYDVLVKSTLFGLRNADKVVNTNDKGKVFADIGQLTNAAKTAAQLDNALGKGAQAAINAMGSVAKGNKALEMAGKGANWASKHVNPLLVGAAGYRVAVADDKETALKREIFGMTSMFAVEGAIKTGLRSNYMQSIRQNMNNKHAKVLLGIIEGVGFVLGSIAGSTAGYKIGEYFYPERKLPKNSINLNIEELKANALKSSNIKNIDYTKTPAKAPENKAIADDIDESEYFAVTKNGKTLA